MSEIVVIGGGIAGLSSAMLLARDGHHVTLLERDPAPPPEPTEAWAEWERRGVNQFRLPHYFLARFREVAERELPDLLRALDAAGALRINSIELAPAEFTGGRRDGDERFAQITGRRPVVEATFARLAAEEPGVEIRRGVAVRGLTAAEPTNGDVPHVVGVVTDTGDRIDADLVVDAGGRRSALPDWLEGDRRPPAGRGGRRLRVRLLRTPLPLGRRGAPADVRAAAPALRLGDVAHPAGRQRHLVGDTDRQRQGRRDAPGARCRHVGTDRARLSADRPLGRRRADHGRRRDREDRRSGAPLHGRRRAGRHRRGRRGRRRGRAPTRRSGAARPSPCSMPCACATCCGPWAPRTPTRWRGSGTRRPRPSSVRGCPTLSTSTVTGWPRSTPRSPASRTRPTIPPGSSAGALRAGAAGDPDLLRAYVSVAGVLARGVDVFAQPGILDKVLALGEPEPPPGPTREELLAIVGG